MHFLHHIRHTNMFIIKVQLKLVKMASRMVPNVRQMENISSLTDDRQLFANIGSTTD